MYRTAKIVAILGLTILFFLRGACAAADIKKADELFEKGTFQEALKEYDGVYKETDKEEVRWMAFFRACESLAHLFRYGEAAQRLITVSVPEKMPYHARVLILKAELLRNFSLQYAHYQGQDVLDEEGKEVFRLTHKEVSAEVAKAYAQLWELREGLLNWDIKKEEYFLDIKGADFGMYPTLFDFLIFSWTNFLISQAQGAAYRSVLPEAGEFLVEDFKQAPDLSSPPVLLAAQLMEEASRLGRNNRLEAAERWKIKRLLLVLKYRHLFDMKGLAGDRMVFDGHDSVVCRVRSKEILLKWFNAFRSKQAKAEAGFEAASILNHESEFLEAVRLCERIERDFPGTHGSRHAEALRSSIQMPQLYLNTRAGIFLRKQAFDLNARNLKTVYFRAFRMDPDRLRQEYEFITRNKFYGWSHLFQPHQDWLKYYLDKMSADIDWVVKTEDKGDYKTINKAVDFPEAKPGIYLVLACADSSFNIGSSLLSAGFANLTDFVLIGTPGFTTRTQDAYYDFLDGKGPEEIEDEGFRFYAFDAKTGNPLENVEINTYIRPQSHNRQDTFLDLSTNSEGSASLALPVNVSPRHPNYLHLDPLAKKGESYAYWQNTQYLNYYPPAAVELFLETDRPIYRPGNTVQAKVIALRRLPDGFKTLGSAQSITVSVYDPNYKEFFTKALSLNEYGSASFSFEIPAGRLLGRYNLQAKSHWGRFMQEQAIYFSVEEYKRPEFEINLKPADKPWKYNQPVKILGQARYYFGGPLPDADITYRIKRQTYVPCFYRFWFQSYHSGSGQEIAQGKLKTDSEGNFIIPFVPTPPGQAYGSLPDIAQFLVEVEGRDSGGRTITAEESYKAGKNSGYFIVEPKKGFFLENEPPEIEAKLLTLNDAPYEGESNYEVYLLQDNPANPLTQIGYSRWSWIPPLDAQLKDNPNRKLISAGIIQHDKEGKGLIKLLPLDEGTYRIILRSEDEWQEEIKQEKVFVVAKNLETAVPINAASVTLVEKEEYSVGETARFIIGSSLGSGIYQVEIWLGEHLLRSQLYNAAMPVKLIEIPVTGEMKGGFSLRWFGIKDFNLNYGQVTVAVPWKEKKLNIALEPFAKELKPGQEANWGINVKDAKGTPQEAEVLCLMYDRSLEYYLQSQNPWLDNLYTLRSAREYSYGIDSLFNPYMTQIPITEGVLQKLLKAFRSPSQEPLPPGLRAWRTWAEASDLMLGGGGYGGQMVRMAKTEAIGMVDSVMLAMEEAPMQAVSKARGDLKEAEKKNFVERQQQVEARKEFADTAFFKPHLVTAKDGKAIFNFTAPEQLTSWRIKAFAFTKDAKEGTLLEEAVTKKELMVRLDLPRFFREKDQGTITAIVHNEKDVVLEGELLVEIKEKDELINDKVKLIENRKAFQIQPHSLASFDWMIEIPQGISTYKIRAVAVAQELSDAEERELPILPSRERLIESAFISLLGSQKKELRILLKDDPSRINESMVLQVDPQLTLSILNSIPFLVQYPHECLEQTLNKFVPLSIVNEIYKKYPAIQSAVSKIPKRQTPTPAWEKDDPQRMISLMETPWVWQSEGRPTCFPIIDLLDPEIVKAQKERALERLRVAQLDNGAFPWWPGGQADAYMTLYILAGFAEARHYGVEIPREIIDRALGYVNKEIPLRLKAEERDLSLAAYAAYVLTSYSPQEFFQAKAGFEAARSWAVFLEKNIHALTPLGKAYLAYTYLRLGDKQKANEILDMAMDGVREDPIAGAYWTPEKYSWVWYSDTVEKHAFFLRALQELRPEDKLIPGMVQWLLFNRKGSVWKSTKASSAAIYALLDYLNKIGALASNEVFKVKWGKVVDSAVVEADDWLEEPLRWQESGFEIAPEQNSALVEKEGPGIAFASLTWTYSTDQLPEASSPGMLELERKFYRRVKEGETYHLKPILSGDTVQVGEQVEVYLKINTRAQFEYMHLKDPKAAGFEAETLLSGWKYDPLSFYEEPRDSLTNFFLGWLPHGEYILHYRLRPTKPGIYRIGAATLQSMYAPEMTAHSAGFIIRVAKEIGP